MTFPKDFKEALSHLPSKEKDKLILRLLKKDLVLSKRLLFELVNTNTVDEQRNIVKKSILKKAKRHAERFYRIDWLNMDVRELSGEINHHVSITKDKFGEAHLNLIMLNEVLLNNKENISSCNFNDKSRKFFTAVIARVFKILILISKLNKDFLIEFEDDLKALGEHISNNNYFLDTAIDNRLDINWLLIPDIPEDIVNIHKNLRANGFLK